MFLAIREIRHQPTRFVLIVAVIALVAYLTFFLSALANGLAHSYRAGVDAWDATTVVLTQDSNSNISASRLTADQTASAQRVLGEDASALVAAPVVVEDPSGGSRTDAYAFGIDPGSLLEPTVSEGSAITDPSSQVIAADALRTAGWSIGDPIRLSGSDHEWRIVGFSADQTFQTAPIVFVDREALEADGPASLALTVNAVVSRVAVPAGSQVASDLDRDGLEALDRGEFLDTLPGYQAQVLTFGLMIGSLVVIAAFVLAIFIYVLTLQKRSVLGILKARGVPTSYLVFSGAAQTTLLAAAGVVSGLGLTLATSLGLPGKVPFRLDLPAVAVITVAFVVCAVLGGLISVRVVSRIDPVEAIS